MRRNRPRQREREKESGERKGYRGGRGSEEARVLEIARKRSDIERIDRERREEARVRERFQNLESGRLE